VADRASEIAHAYRDSAGSGVTVVRELGFGLAAETSRATALDGGRDVTGEVDFTLHADVGLPALLVLRATTTGNPELTVRIGVNTGEALIRLGCWVQGENAAQPARTSEEF
jgi:class 3 adenylate cyclase